jgi:hypothetical protein
MNWKTLTIYLFNIACMIGNYNKPISDKEMLMDKYGVDIWG